MTHICNITSEYEYVSSIVNYQYDIGDEFHYIMSCNYLKREYNMLNFAHVEKLQLY
jgi:hypothetical protein